MDETLKKRIAPLAGFIITAAALYFIHSKLSHHNFNDIRTAIAAIPWYRLVMALGFMIVNYAVLMVNDGLALRFIGKTVSWCRVAFASFVSNTISFNFGMSLLTGGSSRYGIYSSYGLSASETAKILAFCSLSIWLGSSAILSMLFLSEPTGLISGIPFLKNWGSIPGYLMVFFILTVGVLSWSGKSIRLRGHDISFPPLKFFFAQISISLMDFFFASMVLFSLLPESGITLHHYLGCYVISVFLGSLSQVPGGLGILDSTLMLALSPWYSAPDLIGALMVYRFIYYIIPLSVTIVLLTWQQFSSFAQNARNVTAFAGKIFIAAYPRILSAGAFISGAVLLFSSATPGLPGRLSVLRELLPDDILELSNFLGSLAGLGIMLLSQGIRRRVRIAWTLTTMLLAAGVIISLAKGLDYEEALLMAALLIPLAAARKYFDRKSKLIYSGLSLNWLMSLAVVVVSAAWLGYFSHKHGEFANQTILQFAISGRAPWFLKASVSMSIAAIAVCLWSIFRIRSGFSASVSGADMEKVRGIVGGCDQASAALALLGDKSFLFSPSGESMIFFAEGGGYWFAMGDPIGNRAEFKDLAWSFRENAAMNGAKVVYYEATDRELPLYIEQGFILIKIGESGRVPLENISFDNGHEWHGQRYTLRKLAKEGASFRVIPAEEIPSVLPRLRAISDEWLKSKQGREKGFSLGFFDEEYVKQFRAAVVERNGEIEAFTNLWASSDKNELSLDLMRYADNAPKDTMEFLFLNVILWAKSEGYAYFDLGMAPLSGITGGPYSSLWSRAAELLYKHGDLFYNFRGLRSYKEKYHPVWEPRYLAVQHELSLPSVLTAAALLISKGPKGRR